MKKIGHIAARDFLATVGTRGFIVGLLVVPVSIALVISLSPRLFRPRDFQVQGQVAIVDPTGRVTAELRGTLDPRTIAERRRAIARQAMAAVPDEMRQFGSNSGSDEAIQIALGGIPNLTLVERSATADLQQEKQWLTGELTGEDALRPLALVVVSPDAVTPESGRTTYGAYSLYLAAKVGDRVENQIQQSIREAIVDARARTLGLEPGSIDSMVRVDRVRSVTITKEGEQQTISAVSRALPFVFVVLLMIGVMMGGQSLLTTTIEEKSNRVIEVLLSAVSPLELMAGKILGQMGVSLAVLGVYVLLGIVLLLSFALVGLLDPWLVFYLVIFFVITYLVMGSLMVAVGSTVNDMHEAQSLVTPIIMLMVVPVMFAAPIAQDPTSRFSIVMSFIPPFNTFAMLLRLASTVPPPGWQVWLSIGVGLVSVLAAVWFAAKVFQIGLLMYGKPPNLATLIRWVRAGS
jgi:ABC-2 type transport system permease protein